MEPYKISRWMGHENLTATTTIYAHLINTDYAAEAAKFATMFAAKAQTDSPASVIALHG